MFADAHINVYGSTHQVCKILIAFDICYEIGFLTKMQILEDTKSTASAGIWTGILTDPPIPSPIPYITPKMITCGYT